MKNIALAMCVMLGWISMNAFADGDAYNGFSLDYVRSTQNGVNDSSSAAAILRSVRPNEHYGYEMQFGLIGKSGPFTSSTSLDFCAIGVVPLNNRGLKLYGKAGLADVYSRGLPGRANNLGLTYGAGFEFFREKDIVRVGFQHFNVGNNTLSPSLGTYLIGLTLLLN